MVEENCMHRLPKAKCGKKHLQSDKVTHKQIAILEFGLRQRPSKQHEWMADMIENDEMNWWREKTTKLMGDSTVIRAPAPLISLSVSLFLYLSFSIWAILSVSATAFMFLCRDIFWQHQMNATYGRIIHASRRRFSNIIARHTAIE